MRKKLNLFCWNIINNLCVVPYSLYIIHIYIILFKVCFNTSLKAYLMTPLMPALICIKVGLYIIWTIYDLGKEKSKAHTLAFLSEFMDSAFLLLNFIILLALYFINIFHFDYHLNVKFKLVYWNQGGFYEKY